MAFSILFFFGVFFSLISEVRATALPPAEWTLEWRSWRNFRKVAMLQGESAGDMQRLEQLLEEIGNSNSTISDQLWVEISDCKKFLVAFEVALTHRPSVVLKISDRLRLVDLAAGRIELQTVLRKLRSPEIFEIARASEKLARAVWAENRKTLAQEISDSEILSVSGLQRVLQIFGKAVDELLLKMDQEDRNHFLDERKPWTNTARRLSLIRTWMEICGPGNFRRRAKLEIVGMTESAREAVTELEHFARELGGSEIFRLSGNFPREILREIRELLASETTETILRYERQFLTHSSFL